MLHAEDQSQTQDYGWKAEMALQQRSLREYDSWLIQQAQSYLGELDLTLEQANELWSRIDINTRLPIEAPTPRSIPAWQAALRALVGVGILVTVVACSNTGISNLAPVDSSGYGVIDKPFAIIAHGIEVYKIIDDEAENVCYITWSNNGAGNIECMVDKERDDG